MRVIDDGMTSTFRIKIESAQHFLNALLVAGCQSLIYVSGSAGRQTLADGQAGVRPERSMTSAVKALFRIN